MKNEKKVCCFLGHRKICDAILPQEKVSKVIGKLIEKENVGIFLFGSKSEFDDLCREIVARFKEQYPQIHRVYIRAEYQHISDSYEKYLMNFCDETYYSNRAINAGKGVYIQRNYELIDKSDICVVYYDEKYKQIKRKNNMSNLPEIHSASGTHLAYEYAKKKNKTIINVK